MSSLVRNVPPSYTFYGVRRRVMKWRSRHGTLDIYSRTILRWFVGDDSPAKGRRTKASLKASQLKSTVLSIECSRNSGRAESFDVDLFEVDYDPL